MLNVSAPRPWLNADIWMCLLSLMNANFNSSTVEVISTEDMKPIMTTNQWAFYLNNQLQSGLKPAVIDALLIYKQLPQLNMYGRYNRVALVTQDLEDVTSLWTTSRLLDTVVLHFNDSHINAYTWYPYKEKQCHPRIQFLDVCVNGKWNQDLYPNKMPNHFNGCPVYYKSTTIPPDDIQLPNGTFIGRETVFMNILAESLNLTVQYVPSTLDFFDTTAQGDSAMAMIKRGDIDFAFATVVLLLSYYEHAEPLQPYRDQPVAWMIPLAKPKSKATSIYTIFPAIMWFGIFSISLSAGILIMINAFINNDPWDWLDIVASLVAFPFDESRSKFTRIFLIYFQFYSLHIAWFYQGFLLNNLINTPMQKQMTSAFEAVDAKMTAYLYDWMSMYFNNSDYELWNKILSPKGHELKDNNDMPYDKIVIDKSGFILSILETDGFEMRRKYRRSLVKMVYIKRFLNNPVTAYGHRGSPLTTRYGQQICYMIQSGILEHLTALELEYSDLPDKESTSAQVLEIEPLLGAFLLLGGMLIIAFIVFMAELLVKTEIKS